MEWRHRATLGWRAGIDVIWLSGSAALGSSQNDRWARHRQMKVRQVNWMFAYECAHVPVRVCVCVYPETTHWHKSRARISNLCFIIVADWQHINQCATAAWYTAQRGPPATGEASRHEAELRRSPHRVSPILRDSLYQLHHRYCTLNSSRFAFTPRQKCKQRFPFTAPQANNCFFFFLFNF